MGRDELWATEEKAFMIRKIIIAVLIIVVAGIVIYVGWSIMILSAFGFFDKDYSVTELKENFNNRQNEIYELKEYYNSVVPDNRFVEIEFEDKNTIGRFGISELDSITGRPNKSIFLDWHLKIDSEKIDSLLRTLNWTESTLIELKDKLENANCIQIESGEPTKIGFQRSGMGMYFFNIFERPIPDSLISYYNDSCTYIYVNKNLVLEFGGGAIGPQCFYDFN